MIQCGLMCFWHKGLNHGWSCNLWQRQRCAWAGLLEYGSGRASQEMWTIRWGLQLRAREGLGLLPVSALEGITLFDTACLPKSLSILMPFM